MTGSFVTASLKEMPRRNYSEEMDKSKRLIQLTRDGADALLRMAEAKKLGSSNPKKPPEKTMDTANRPARIPFKEFERMLRERSSVKKAKEIWDSLVKDHPKLFVISNRSCICYNELDAAQIESALNLSKGYIERATAKAKKKTYGKKKAISNSFVDFLRTME